MKKFFINILIMFIAIMLGLGSTSVQAMQDYQGSKAKTLRLSYFRYINGGYTNGYALNTVGNEGESHHPIYQIMNENNNTNYYCLNATAGESWLSGTIGTSATYNRSYDLNSSSDIEALKADSSLSTTYRNVVNSKYLNQIMWILDNMYVADQTQGTSQKQELLAKAGIVFGDVDDEDAQGNVQQGYRYIAQPGYDYSSKVSTQGKKGYFYYDTNSNYHSVELPDDLVEVAGQTALWYYTNYLDNNSNNSTTYDVKSQWLPLLSSNGFENTNTDQWKALESETEDTNVSNVKAEVGKMKQEQAAILCQYLIDAANNNATSSDSETTGNPLQITPENPNIEQKSVSGTEYYVVGPIKIDETRTSVYSLNNNIYVNDDTNTGAYISDETGSRNSDQTVGNHVGKEFYVSVPKTKITGNTIKIGFDGKYKTNKKTLWISTTKTEQPIVEVTPKEEQFELEVNTELTEITVTKVWDDYSNKENTRKNYGITLTGKIGDQVVYKNQVNLEPSVTAYTWTGLAKYKDGQEITYTVDETTVPEGYTKTVNGYTITNKFETTTQIEGTKTWKDYDNKENTRPSKIRVYLVKNGTKTNSYKDVTEADGWKYSFTDLEKYDENNNLISYSVEEEAISNYVTTYDGNNITNTYTVKTKISGTKTWIDYDNKDNTRPNKIRIYLVKNGTKTDSYKDVTEADGWSYSFEDLDKYDENNNLITYSVEEEKVDNYTTTYDGNNITNKYVAKTSIEGTKTWIDNDNQENTRPSKIRVYLVKNGTKTDSYKDVTEADGWKYSFTDLEKYDENNNLISYSVEEDAVENYSTTYEGNNITNKYKPMDLALRKNIKQITDSESKTKMVTNEAGDLATRKISYDAKNIEKTGTAIYNHRKDPVVVEKGDIVTYQITVYNEGDVNGYALEIVDKLPDGLKLKGNKTGTYKSGNIEYSYTYNEQTNEIVLKNVSKNVLSAYDGSENLSLETIEIECEVVQSPSITTNTYLTNIAYISKEYNDETKKEILKDRDSETTNAPSADQKTTGNKYTGYHGGDNNNGDNNKDVYKDGLNNDDYFPGKEDDDDFEVIVIKPEKIDLALTKFITAVSEDIKIEDGEYLTANGNIGSKTNPYTRATKVDTKELRDNKDCHDATYVMVKDPLTVPEESYILYNIRVYNEGEKDVYAGEVADYLPEYLDYVDCEFNTNYGWKLGEDGRTVKTNYLAYNKNDKEAKNLLKAFDKANDDGEGSGLDYRDIQILCRVNSKAPEATNLVNSAEITKYQNKNGEDISEDIDSKPENLQDKNKEHREEDDDDYEVVNIKKKKVDLALTKFITAISDDTKIEDGEYLTSDGKIGSKTNPYTRATKVDTKELRDNKDCHDATYVMVKDPLTVPEESYILYNIRVYNEGEKDVYAGEVADYLPEYLDYVDCEFNTNYGWKLGEDGRTVKTNYLAYNKNDKEAKNLLKAFDKANDDGEGSGLDYRDIQILCRVNSKAPEATNLVNSAEITKYQNKNGEDISEDIDSKPENLQDKNKEHREEDDDDYEVVNIKKKKVDLALTKFITAISDDTKIEDGEYLTSDGKIGSKTNPYTRATKVDTKELRDNADCHDATYVMVKDPLTVPAKSYVLYNIRVYNEGETDVYAGEITDHLPEYLDYVDCEFNTNYGWQVGSDGKTIKSSYLGYNENDSKATNLLKAFDKKKDNGEGSGLDYRDIQVLCRVNEKAPSNTNIVNVAEITKYQKPTGEDISEDIDSIPNNVDKKNEDDDDYEVINVKTFDLSLLKYVSTVYVTEDGNTKTTETGNTGDDKKDIIPKVEINKKKLNSTVVKFGYTIKITNEGDIAGYAKEITDYVPEGLQFYGEDNEGWTDEGNNVISTRLLENTLLQPGESAEVTVILRWINGSSNLGLKTNTAEISEDFNEWGIPDRDSTPDNQVPGEDDIDDASVLLSIATGMLGHIVMYTVYGAVILIVFVGGIRLIKKHVL